MAQFAFADLVRPMTVDEAKKSIYDVLAVVGTNTTGWKPGAVVRTMITAFAICVASLSVLISLIARSGFLELSEGLWLTLVAWYVYGVSRFDATFALGEVTIDNLGGGVYELEPGDLVVFNPATKKTYRNVELVSIGSNELGVVVSIVAVEAGAASTSSAGTITGFETPLLGLTCTNALAVVGQDAEDDPSLRARCLEKPAAASPNGPKEAYAHFARSAKLPDGTPIGATRLRLTKDGLGNVYLHAATATGGISGDAEVPTTPLGALADNVIRNAEPLSITTHVASATIELVPVTYEVWMYNTSALTAAQIQATIATRLAKFMSEQPIGGNKIGSDPGKVFHDAIRGNINGARPEIFHVAVSTPASDDEISPFGVPVLGAVGCTGIHLVAPPTV